MLKRFLALLRDSIELWLGTVAKPGQLAIHITNEVRIMIFQVSIPSVTAADVVRGQLSVTSSVGGVVGTQVIEVAPGQSVVSSLVGDEGTAVELSFVWIDDAANSSEASTLSAVLTDTIAPGVPGSLSIEITGE